MKRHNHLSVPWKVKISFNAEGTQACFKVQQMNLQQGQSSGDSVYDLMHQVGVVSSQRAENRDSVRGAAGRIVWFSLTFSTRFEMKDKNANNANRAQMEAVEIR